jgi:hypothetical protein
MSLPIERFPAVPLALPGSVCQIERALGSPGVPGPLSHRLATMMRGPVSMSRYVPNGMLSVPLRDDRDLRTFLFSAEAIGCQGVRHIDTVEVADSSSAKPTTQTTQNKQVRS